MKDYEHPFFRPLWRRVAVVAVCVVWALIEYMHANTGWATIAAGLAVYGGYQFFYLYKPREDAPAGEETKTPE
jgi:hypothetical protein